MTALLDVNVLVALAWPNHVHHTVARAWFAENHAEGWATCSVTEAGFIRVSSNRRVTPDARSPGEAALVLARMCKLAGHQFLSDAVSLSQHAAAMAGVVHGSSQVTDAHLLLIAKDHLCPLVSFDRGVLALGEALDVPVVLLSV